jgi:hypothetical protein
MLCAEQALKYERVEHSASVSHVYIFMCSDCGLNKIRVERKNLKSSRGLCMVCAHKGIPYMASYNNLRDGVARTNIKRPKQKEFSLTFEEFLEFVAIKECHYCNREINWVAHTGSGKHRYNLDRKDSSLGYIKFNCVVCCKECNMMKNAYFSYEEFKCVVLLLETMRGNFIFKKRESHSE